MKENKSKFKTLNSSLEKEQHYRNNDIFSQTIRETKVLTDEEQKELAREVKRDKNNLEAYQKLVYSNLRLVIYLADKNIVHGILDKDDLIQFGYLGLLEACLCKNYNPDSDKKFSSYITSAINNSIYDGKKKFTSLHLETKSQYGEIAKLNNVIIDLTQKLDREPKVEEIAKTIGFDVNKVEELLQIKNNSSNSPLEDYMTYEENKSEDTEIKSNYSLKCLKKLDERQQKILKMRFGINKENIEYTYKEISKELNISLQRVNQIEKRAIEILRKEYENDKSFGQITKN